MLAMPEESEKPITKPKVLSLRLSEPLWKAVHRCAGYRTQSVTAYITAALESAVAADEAAERKRILET